MGDILVIDDGHKKAGADIAEMVAKNWKGEKLSLAVGAESGAGKSEIAHQVSARRASGGTRGAGAEPGPG
ncbi:MAG: hypothetical protein QGF97_00755, partial [Alphaproteobacteria bacterium]|nr:hypothetical protein [Alphaproteobacteria bacterium]